MYKSSSWYIISSIIDNIETCQASLDGKGPMLSSSSSIVRAAIEKAENRASVLISLEKSYGSTAHQKTPKKQLLACAIPPSVGGGRQIQTLQAVLCDDSEKLRKSLHDSLLGKSIVLTNLKSQMDASKSAKRVKRSEHSVFISLQRSADRLC